MPKTNLSQIEQLSFWGESYYPAKTDKMSAIEKKYNMAIGDILTQLYVVKSKTTRQVADALGVSRQSISTWLDFCNIPSHTKGGTINFEKERKSGLILQTEAQFDEDVINLLNRLYIKEKHSAPEISNILGVSQGTIYRWLKSADIPTRSYREAKQVTWQNEDFHNKIVKKRQSQEYREKRSKEAKQLWKDAEYRRRQREAKPQAAKKMSKIMSEYWQDEKYREETIKKILDGRYNNGKYDSSLELYFDMVTPDEVKRNVGNYISVYNDSQYVQEGYPRNKIPDFWVDGEKNKIIELFGDFWHKKAERELLIEAYSGIGYESRIFWEHEVYDNTESVLKKVSDFIGENTWQMKLSFKKNK